MTNKVDSVHALLARCTEPQVRLCSQCGEVEHAPGKAKRSNCGDSERVRSHPLAIDFVSGAPRHIDTGMRVEPIFHRRQS